MQNVEFAVSSARYGQEFLDCQSHIREAGCWDICLVYEVHARQEIKTPEWHMELAFKAPTELIPEG